MKKKIKLIENLINELNNIPNFDFDNLDRLKKKSLLVVRKIFWDNSLYIKELQGISFSPMVFPANERYRTSSWNWWKNSYLNTLKTIIDELELDIWEPIINNKKENDNSLISNWTHIQAWWDVIIWDNNKKTINEIDKLLGLLNKWNIDNKVEIKELLEEFKKTKDKSKLVDVFSVLWSWASINSMIIALSSLIV